MTEFVTAVDISGVGSFGQTTFVHPRRQTKTGSANQMRNGTNPKLGNSLQRSDDSTIGGLETAYSRLKPGILVGKNFHTEEATFLRDVARCIAGLSRGC